MVKRRGGIQSGLCFICSTRTLDLGFDKLPEIKFQAMSPINIIDPKKRNVIAINAKVVARFRFLLCESFPFRNIVSDLRKRGATPLLSVMTFLPLLPVINYIVLGKIGII
mmetsp:Transcript_2321/g.3452  ORF Transcript_2321/g.3452 Transcript_2321/m.3452 type:complete len:110 (-) Transcript_2321:86-415(-)